MHGCRIKSGMTTDEQGQSISQVAALAGGRRAGVGVGVPGVVGPAHLVQDRARRAGLPADVHLRADAGQLPRGAVRHVVDPAQPVVEHRGVERVHLAHHAVRGAGGLRAGAAALSGQEVHGLLRAGHADAAAGGPDHPVLPGAAEGGPAGQLQRPHGDLPHVLAAFRGVADGVVLRGHPVRDGGGRAAGQGRAHPHALVRGAAAGGGRHRRHHRVRVPQCVERISFRRRARRQQREAGHRRHVQFHFRRTDAMGAARGRRDAGHGARHRDRAGGPAPHRQGAHRRGRQGGGRR